MTAEIYQTSEDEAVKLFFPSYSLVAAVEEHEKTAFVGKVYEKALRMEAPGQFHDRIALKMELVRGDQLARHLSGGDVREVGMSLGLMHRDLHIRPSEGLPRAYGIYEPAILEYPGLGQTERNGLTSYLRSRRDDRLCHGDFHPGNILQTRDGWRLIDWPRAFAGDPLADIARTLALMRRATRAGRRLPLLEPLLRGRLIRWYLTGYFGKAEIPEDDLARWDLLNVLLQHRVSHRYRLFPFPRPAAGRLRHRIRLLF